MATLQSLLQPLLSQCQIVCESQFLGSRRGFHLASQRTDAETRDLGRSYLTTEQPWHTVGNKNNRWTPKYMWKHFSLLDSRILSWTLAKQSSGADSVFWTWDLNLNMLLKWPKGLNGEWTSLTLFITLSSILALSQRFLTALATLESVSLMYLHLTSDLNDRLFSAVLWQGIQQLLFNTTDNLWHTLGF